MELGGSEQIIMDVCIFTCKRMTLQSVHMLYPACCLLEQSEGSFPQLPLNISVELEGRGSLGDLEEEGKTFTADFNMLICHTVKTHMKRPIKEV